MSVVALSCLVIIYVIILHKKDNEASELKHSNNLFIHEIADVKRKLNDKNEYIVTLETSNKAYEKMFKLLNEQGKI